MHLVDLRQVAGLRLLELAVPALQLARDVPLLLAEVAEADRVGVHRVDAGKGVGDGQPGVATGLPRDRVGGLGVAQDLPVDELHDVERRAVHGLVRAEAEGGGDGHVGGAECGDDLVLAASCRGP